MRPLEVVIVFPSAVLRQVTCVPADADAVATAVMMLLDNPYMTGQTVAMSGGMAFN